MSTTRPRHCPHCGADLRGEPIPQEYLDRERADFEAMGQPAPAREGDNLHFRRSILVEIPGVYDGGLFYQCPDCGGRWHRWPEGDRLYELAKSYVERRAVPPTMPDAA
ncbi:hypothetical protein E1091_06565 [Micromonospora fluostatini]|uniref:Transcription factor zinc-finger domain-containing protein n=1 Tax=Micromonospora fluostatini TaxID=1629071 RepID=A0ABY2DIS5_9ACTN|nr:hypothetical protein E1091_06565 [Micromonospora fluostatini]